MVLVERDVELAALRAAVTRAASGTGSATLVTGPPGIGKSALLDELTAHLEGVRILRARGGELERDFPYGVVRQLFETTLRTADDELRDALLSGPARPASALVEDEIGTAPGDTAALEHAVYWLVVNLAECGPLVLVVDDAHWADLTSLRSLVYLARRVAEHPVAVVVATRPADGPHRDLLERLAVETVAIDLPPISVAGVGRFLLHRLVSADDAFCAACHDASGGNPFLVTAVIDAVEAFDIEPVAANAARIRTLDLQNVRRSVLLRMGALAPEATPVARALAVLDESAQADAVAHVAGTSVDATTSALDELRSAHVLAPDDPLRFTHSIVRSAVYQDIPTAQRSRLHGIAARRLARTGSSPDAVAGHLLLTAPGSDPWVFDHLVSAATGGLAASTPETAAAYLDRALQEAVEGTDRAHLLLRLGAARYQTVGGGAVEPLTEALALAIEPRLRAAIGQALASALMTENRYDECWTLVDRLVTELRAHPDSVHDVELFGAQALYTQLDTAPAQLPRVAAWRPDPHGATARDRSMLAVQAWVQMGRPASAEVVAATARAALSTGTLVADDTYAVSFEMAVWALVGAGQYEEALASLDAAIASRRAVGQLLRAATLMVLRTELRRRLGHLQLAEEDARLASDVIARDQVFAPQAASMLMFVLLDRGAVDQARTVLHAHGFDDAVPDGGLHDLVWLARGRLRLAEGDIAGGVRDVLHYGAVCESLGRRNPGYFPWRSTAATALVQLGRRDEAGALARADCVLAELTEVPGVRGRALSALATTQRGEAAVATATAAVGLLADSPLVLDAAEARIGLGRALRLAGRREQAREPMRQALDTATRLDAQPMAERARHELLAAGARPRRPALQGVAALTPTELRVASLAAQGLTNRQLAHTLYVSPKTIETHLAATYRKLGVAGKAELAAVLAAS